MKSKAPVTVVIPCYRCTQTIVRAVQSIAVQTQQPTEVILVDDASNDETWSLLCKLETDYPGWVKIIQLATNQGAASARNAGWAQASQPFIAFLDSDDAWHPQKIEMQYAFMSANPDVALSGHGFRLLKHQALPVWTVTEGPVQQISKWALMVSNKFVTPSVMVRRDVGHQFVEKQRYMEDHMLWLKIICSGGLVVKLSAELAAIYKAPFGAAGLSSRVWLMERGDLGNYRRLYYGGFIRGYQFAVLIAFSTLKYIRRLVIYCTYLRWKK